MNLRLLALLSYTVLVSAGCYTFQPTTLESLGTGTSVRARLNPAGAQRVAELTGELSREVDGTLMRADPDTIVLAVWRTDLQNQFAFDPGQVQLRLERSLIASMAVRRISYIKTGALAAGIAGGLYLLFQAVWDNAGGGGAGDDGGGTRF